MMHSKHIQHITVNRKVSEISVYFDVSDSEILSASFFALKVNDEYTITSDYQVIMKNDSIRVKIGGNRYP